MYIQVQTFLSHWGYCVEKFNVVMCTYVHVCLVTFFFCFFLSCIHVHVHVVVVLYIHGHVHVSDWVYVYMYVHVYALIHTAGGLPSGVLQVVGDRVQTYQVSLPRNHFRLFSWPRDSQMAPLVRENPQIRARSWCTFAGTVHVLHVIQTLPCILNSIYIYVCAYYTYMYTCTCTYTYLYE